MSSYLWISPKLRSQSEFVFANPKSGEAYRLRTRLMPTLCQKAEVRPFGLHAIRHLSTTIMAYGGLDIPSVQSVLRHKNPNTTARYIKSLGVQPDKLASVSMKTKTPKGEIFEVLKEAIGA